MIKKEEIFINKRQWNSFSSEEMDSFVNKIFLYYRENGFPYFPTDKEYRMHEFNKLKQGVNNNLIIDGDIVRQMMHGLGLCWSYFPHAYSVECNNFMSPMTAFSDDDIFKKVIRKRIRMGDNISDNGIRKMLKIFSGVQGVSNFRPTAACGLYRLFSDMLENRNLCVWDMSSGYGGRLFGAIVSDVVDTYIGTDPCKATFDGLQAICDDFRPEWKDCINLMGSEEYEPLNDSLDVCFTSPPYFNTERYSNEESQSYKKYETTSDWMNKFLMKTIDNCYLGLKNGGILAINIADVQSYPSFTNDFIDLMKSKSTKWEYINTMKLALSSLKRNRDDKFKYEPIFIFKKI